MGSSFNFMLSLINHITCNSVEMDGLVNGPPAHVTNLDGLDAH